MRRYDIARSGWHRSVTLTGVDKALPEIAEDARRVVARGTRFDHRRPQSRVDAETTYPRFSPAIISLRARRSSRTSRLRSTASFVL